MKSKSITAHGTAKAFLRGLSALLLCLSVLLNYTGCMSANARELTSDVAAQSTPVKLTDEEQAAGAAAVTGFSFRLTARALESDGNQSKENRIVSPMSALLCLAMVSNGAGGNTRAQLEDLFGLPTETLNRYLEAYLQGMGKSDGVSVHIADSVWYRDEPDRLTVNADFLSTVKNVYGAQAYAAPFDASTVRDVNAWGKKQTDGMIEEFVDRIDADAVMILVNALAFDAKWEKEYEKDDVRDMTFTDADGTQVPVKMLTSNETYYLCGDGFEGFTRPYMYRYDFVGLLPTDGTDADALAASLTGEAWQKAWTDGHTLPACGYYPGVKVGIPEFTFDGCVDLKQVLADLGVTDMFDSALADFSPMAVSSNGNIFCGQADQTVFVQVDRNGTRAAAITKVVMNDECKEIISEKTVILDRPFVFAITDRQTGIPLFVGVVNTLS